MSKCKVQNLKNHARIDLFFHGIVFFILLPNLILAIIHLVRHPGICSAWILITVLGLLVLFFKIRQYPVKVQDRLIRMEERMRLQALSPTEWHAQIYNLTEDQLIGLRFAADDEVVELAKQALEHKLNRKQIKERIRSWRADHWRV